MHLYTHTNCMQLDFFYEWLGEQQEIGHTLVDEAFNYIANKYDAYILSNPVNPASYAHFIRSDVQSKEFSIRKRTLRNGMEDGFLEEDSDFIVKPLKFLIDGKVYYAATREGIECLVTEYEENDSPKLVSCDASNAYIVSDIDLVAIYRQDVSKETLFDSEYGELTHDELMMIKDLNQYFQKLLSVRYHVMSTFKLVAHGPINRFSKSKSSFIHYPVKIHTPKKNITYLNQENSLTSPFLNFNQQMESCGYFSGLNPKWEF